jgi:hypothetical protein
MYACFITFFFLVSFDKSGGTAFGTASGAEEELYLSCVGQVKMA